MQLWRQASKNVRPPSDNTNLPVRMRMKGRACSGQGEHLFTRCLVSRHSFQGVLPSNTTLLLSPSTKLVKLFFAAPPS
eukprot:scaffold21465_cov18-Tisochrysis_lutea.AAC.1